MNYPTYIEIDGKKYNINTDFRIAIKCNEVAEDTIINDVERALAVIYLLFGSEALNDFKNHEKLLNYAMKFLSCNQEIKKNKQPDMDFVEDYDYITASFMSDFHIDLDNEQMHWWKFCKLINGLSNSDMGNCCVLNRIRNLRNYDVKSIKDPKERQKIIEAKKEVALKKYQKEKIASEEQKASAENLLKQLGIKKGGN